MQPIKCPNCGAPPPFQIVVPPGGTTYKCPFCHVSSVLEGPPAPAAAPATGQMPMFIVVQGPSHDDDDDDDHHHHHHAAIAHANVARGMSWIIWMVIVLVMSLGGGVAGFSRC